MTKLSAGRVAPRRPEDVRIAYCLLVHHKLENVEAALESVYDARDLFLVHVDAGAARPFADGVAALVRRRANVRLLSRRRVRWAGWSLVAAELAAIRAALAASPGWTHFQNLSGQCLAIRPRDELVALLAAKPGVNFIDVESREQHLGNAVSRRQLEAYVELRFRGRPRLTSWRLPPPVFFRFNWKGAQWHMLTRAFCEWIVRSPLARCVALYCRPLIVPDELYFQQLVMNSRFAAGREDSLHQVYWPGDEPKILTGDDLGRLRASGRFFARKFDADVDRAIMDALAADRRRTRGGAVRSGSGQSFGDPAQN